MEGDDSRMKKLFWLRHAAWLTALLLCVGAYFPTREVRRPDLIGNLHQRFQFSREKLPEPPHGSYRSVREVHPSLRRISAWISSVGAAIALADLDGNGLPDDVCRVDPRTDQVIVSPVVARQDGYDPFELQAPAGWFDRSRMAPMGCLAGDVNEDGLMDLVVYYWGRPPIAFLRNSGVPGARTALRDSMYTPVEIGNREDRWYTNAAMLSDIDGDGHLDLVIGNYFQDGARILDATADGVESMHNTKSKAFNGGRKHFLLWAGASKGANPTVAYREAPNVLDEQVSRGWALAVGAADLNGDGLPELYFANDFGPDRLLLNQSRPGELHFKIVEGRRGFTTPASCVLGRDSFKGMGVDFADVNGDGMLDIYVSNIADTFALQESHFLWLSTGHPELMEQGIAPYEHGSEKLGLARSGWGWDGRLADFDNDGLLEAVQATGFLKGTVDRWPELQALGTGNDELMHNPAAWPAFRPGDDLSGKDLLAFFARDPSGRFQNIGPEVGFGEPMLTRGIAIADIDGDGRLDFAVANQWNDSYVFHNTGAASGAYLGLHLLLPLDSNQALKVRDGHPGVDTPGRPAIGAAATVHLAGGRRLVNQVDGGSGHSGKRSPDLHFGLGSAGDGPLDVDVRWRDSAGRMRSTQLKLRPGWHTVVLGESAG
jgi:enediyne biosynthesis protein E4